MIRDELQVPPSWAWAKFEDVAKVASDLTDPTMIPHAYHIAPNHIESWTGKLLPYRTVAEDGVTSPKHRFRPGQILYSKIRPYLAKATIATFEGVCSADMYPIDSAIEARFLHLWILTPWFTNQAAGQQGRSVLPKINREALAQLLVPVAPLPEQRRIVSAVETQFTRLDAATAGLERTRAKLKRYRASVLKAACEGRLVPTEAELARAEGRDYEGADRLLDRVLKERRARWEADQFAKMEAEGKRSKGDAWKDRYRQPIGPTVNRLPGLPEGWVWATFDQCAHEITVGHVGPMRHQYVETGIASS